jgi:hypothetical protein
MGKSLLLAGLLGLASGAGVVAFAQGSVVAVASAAEAPPPAAAHAAEAPAGAKIEITKLGNGVMIWVTSSDSSEVERVQRLVESTLGSARP